MLKSLLKNITFNKTQKKKRKYLPVSFEFGRKIEESSLAVHGTVNHLCSGNLWEALGKGKPVNTRVKFLFRWPPRSRSIEMEVKISL